MNLAMASVANRQKVLDNIECAPGRIAQVMHLCCLFLFATLAYPAGFFHCFLSDCPKAWMLQILSVSPIGGVVRIC